MHKRLSSGKRQNAATTAKQMYRLKPYDYGPCNPVGACACCEDAEVCTASYMHCRRSRLRKPCLHQQHNLPLFTVYATL
jgi:hypothetical protein